MLDSVVIFPYKDSSDRIGGRGNVQDEVPIKVRRMYQGSGCESMFQTIKRLFIIFIPYKWNARSEESKEPMCGGGIFRYDPTKGIIFALEDL